jgi:hypothetical protein
MFMILEVSKPYPGSNPSDAADQGGPEEAKGSAAPDGAQARVRWATDAQLLKGRAAVTTGSRLLEGGDGRGPWARRMRDLIELHISDLGGIDAASEAERSIIRRAATLTIELERLEAKFYSRVLGLRLNLAIDAKRAGPSATRAGRLRLDPPLNGAKIYAFALALGPTGRVWHCGA